MRTKQISRPNIFWNQLARWSACALLAAGLLPLCACNEFVDDDMPTDTPRRPRLVEGAQSQPATRGANSFSPADQQRADIAIATIKDSGDEKAIEAALHEIARLKDPRGPAAMLAMLRAERLSPYNNKLLALYAQTLAGYRSVDATRELVEIVRAGKRGPVNLPEPRDIRFDAAVAVLTQMRDPRTVEMLIDVMAGNKLTDGSAAAIDILAAIGTAPAINAMKESVTRSPYSRKWFEAICAGLGKLGEDATPAIIELWHVARDWPEREMVLLALLGRQNPEVIAVAKEACKFEDAETRRGGVTLASTLEGDPAWALVIAAIPDPSERVRTGVVTALTLGRGSAGRAGEALGRLAKLAATDEASGVRSFAVRGLEYNLSTSPRLVVETICAVLKSDKASDVRETAASCLNLGSQMIPGQGSAIDVVGALKPAMLDEDEHVAISAARSLLTFGEREQVKAFAEKALAAAKRAKSDEFWIERLDNLLAEAKEPDGRRSPVRIVDDKGELLKGPIR